MTTSQLPALSPKDTAAIIRRVLRAQFPATKFSVTTGRGSGVSSVHIAWTDGPTTARVDAIVAGFEAGHFDGMTDSYSYDHGRGLLIEGQAFRPGTRYIFTNRHHSTRAIVRAARAVLAQRWAFDRAGDEATLAAVVDALEADNSSAAQNAFWNTARLIRPGHGMTDFGQMVSRALADRTTVEAA